MCASRENTKCDHFFDKTIDGLKQNWEGETCWMNPPYSGVAIWMRKARLEGMKPGTTAVCLTYARTDTKWFHEACSALPQLRFLKGRLKFEGMGNKWSAPAPSMLVVFRGSGQ